MRDHVGLERLAGAIAGPRDGPSRGDLTLALTAARLAKALTAGTDARALNTLARVQFAMGANEGAVETQRLAVEKAGQDERQRLERTLEVYRQALK